MRTEKSVGRTIGILLLMQLTAGLVVPFILLSPLATGTPAFLTAATENSFQIRAAVFIFFAGSALTVALGITAFPVFRRYGRATALWFLIACAVSCALDFVHSAAAMSMLALSENFVRGNASDAGLYQAVGAAVAAARRAAHAVQLVAIGGWIFIFYSSLFRFRLVPRPLAALGMAGILLQFTGVTLMMLLGRNLIGELAMPMLPIQIIVSVWLIIKGFKEGPAEDSTRGLKQAEKESYV